jgi:hypothetical protein
MDWLPALPRRNIRPFDENLSPRTIEAGHRRQAPKYPEFFIIAASAAVGSARLFGSILDRTAR